MRISTEKQTQPSALTLGIKSRLVFNDYKSQKGHPIKHTPRIVLHSDQATQYWPPDPPRQPNNQRKKINGAPENGGGGILCPYQVDIRDQDRQSQENQRRQHVIVPIRDLPNCIYISKHPRFSKREAKRHTHLPASPNEERLAKGADQPVDEDVSPLQVAQPLRPS
jgi:hypothetical protein